MSLRSVIVILAFGVVVLPILVVPDGADAYRLPKELLFRAEAMALVALLILQPPKPRRELMLVAAVVAWSILVTATSTNRALSMDSLITIIAAAVIFIATCMAAEHLSLEAIDVLMFAACVNAAITVAQELGIWRPVPTTEGHYGTVGLMGNANDVGTFLVTPAVAAVVMAVVSHGRRRRTYLGISVLLVSGMIASATRTALIAFVAAMLVLAMVQTRRAALAIAAILLLLGIAMLSPSTTIGRSTRSLVTAATERDYQHLFSERLLPFLAAIDMTRDHPLVGVGPGTFRYHFMPYRVGLERTYPPEWTRGFPMNWGAAHNDHLQVAAEAGLIAYVLFLAALVMTTRRTPAADPTPRATFARALRWPLVTAVFVVCLAQFPLELAAPRLLFLTLGALCITWNRIDGARTGAPEWRAPVRASAPIPLFATAAIAACIGIHRLCVIPFRDNITMRELDQRATIAQTLDPYRAAGIARRSLADLDRIAHSQRLNPAWHVLYGANLELLERWQDAADAYTRALAVDQRPEIYFYRGLMMLRLGRIDQAAHDMTTAVRFNPFLIDRVGGDLRARVAAAAGLS